MTADALARPDPTPARLAGGFVDPDARRQDAERRIRTLFSDLADAVIALADLCASPRPQRVELLSVADFALRCGIARSSLYRQLARGAIASVEVGNRRLIPSTELDRLAAAARPRIVSNCGPDRPVSERSRRAAA